MNLPSVTVLSMGGTIAMARHSNVGVVPTLSGADLVAAVPGLHEVAGIRSESFRQLPSAHLAFDDVEALADRIRDLANAGQAGVVITQGTDTLEEVAFALDRLVDADIAVVVTGSMRTPAAVGADGPANLLAAVRVAVDPTARGLGVLVVMNEDIHAARFVRKMHTSSLGAFHSRPCGPIGWVGEGRVQIVATPTYIPALAEAVMDSNARVMLAAVSLGDDGSEIRALHGTHPAGMVVAATGGGHVSPGVADALESAAIDMPVVLASRTGAGPVLEHTYGFTGSEIDLQRRGLIRAGWLDGRKARVLLTLLLRRCINKAGQIRDAFEPWGGGRL